MAMNNDLSLLNDRLNGELYEDIVDRLKWRFKIAMHEETGKPVKLNVTEGDVNYLATVLNYIDKKGTLDVITKQSPCVNRQLTEKQMILLTATYKALRNCCVRNTDVQLKLTNDERITKMTFDNYDRIETILLNSEWPFLLEHVKTLLQFITNLVVDNPTTGESIWQRCSTKFAAILRSQVSNESSALIYNILIKNERTVIQDDVLNALFNVYEKETNGIDVNLRRNEDSRSIGEEARSINEEVRSPNKNEYLIFLLDYCANPRTYRRLSTNQRMVILRQIRAYLIETNDYRIESDLLLLLSDDFKKKSDCILKTVTNYLDDIEPIEVTLLLEVLASLSGKSDGSLLRNDNSLLINCSYLLRSIHSLGKDGVNNFSVIAKLPNAKDAIEHARHAAYGFKGNLIRLIGNLCWRCKKNQDRLRELDAIPLLLDCCNMDARNPFIIQWTVLAIRNLCEENSSNQELIASMTRLGQVKSSTLDEIGITIDDNDTIKMVSLEALKKNADESR